MNNKNKHTNNFSKIIQKIFIGFAALSFVVGGVFVFTKNADAVVFGSTVNGFVAPVTGAVPQTSGLTVNPGSNPFSTIYGATVANPPTWSAADSSYLGSSYLGGKVYIATVVLSSVTTAFPLSGLPPPAVDVPAGQSFNVIGVGEGTEIGNTFTYSVTFPATLATDIATAGVTGFIAPVTGGTPRTFTTLTPVDASYTVTGLDWAPTDDPYSVGIGYTATVTLKSASGFKFPVDGWTVPLTADGGGTLSDTGTTAGGNISGNTLSFPVTFPPTVALPTDIITAGVTGLTAPVTGATPQEFGTLIPVDASYTVANLTWSPDNNPYYYDAETAYTATVTLVSLPGYKFPLGGIVAPTADVGTVNSGGTTSGPDASGNTLSYTVTFPATVSTDITSAGVNMFAAPATGGTPRTFTTLTPVDASYTVTGLTWDPTDNPYIAETVYTATVTLISLPGYKFPIGGIATPTVNVGVSNSGTTWGPDASGNTLSFTVTFPATVATDITSAGVNMFAAPVTDGTPITVGTLAPNDASYTVTDLTWDPIDNPYLAETTYTATVTLTSASGYKFPIDGSTVALTADGGGTASGGTTFGPDASSNILSFTVTFPATVATDITTAGVFGFTAPVTDLTPITAGGIAANDGSQYTVTDLTWDPMDSPYLGAKIYTATVTLTSALGYKFPLGGIVAPTADVGTVNSGGTTSGPDASGNILSFTVTFPETATPLMTGSVAISGTTKFGQVLTATPSLTYTPSTSSDVPTYQWKRDGTNIGTDSPTYTLVEADIGSTITVTVTADGTNATGDVTSDPTGTITLADGPSAPGAPTLSSKTATSITLTAISGNEFSIDSGSTWQDSNVFNGLTASTSYTFTARVKETTTTNASLSSVASASITTDAEITASPSHSSSGSYSPNYEPQIIPIQVPGCDNRITGFSITTGYSCSGNTPAQVPGCGNRTIGFSTATGYSCQGNHSATIPNPQVNQEPRVYDFGTITLKYWSKGEAVKELQRFLNDKLNLGLVVDGILGSKTIAIIKNWQQANGLVADGLLGPKTKAMMNIIAAQ